MRNYFGFDMKGGKVFLPFMAGWVLLMAIEGLAGWFVVPRFASDPPLSGEFLLNLLYGLISVFAALVALLWVLFYFVRATVSGVSLAGERFGTDYEMGPYMRMCLKGALLTTVTLGVYLPWLVANVARYFAGGTAFRFNPLDFKGRASTLFIYIALFVVAPVFVAASVFAAIWAAAAGSGAGAVLTGAVLWLIIVLSLSVYRAVSIKWFINFTYGGRKRIVSEAQGWQGGVFIFGQYLLCIVTLGLYYPMALIRIWRYYAGRVVLGEEFVEDTFGFSMRAWPNYLTVLGQLLLVAVTLGIYYPWAYARIGRLLVSQSYVETREDGKSVPMPPDPM